MKITTRHITCVAGCILLIISVLPLYNEDKTAEAFWIGAVLVFLSIS